MVHLLLFAVLCTFFTYVTSQTLASDDGYTGYTLSVTGDGDSAVYETANTDTSNGTATTPPDVFLNATVYVGEIDITVSNLTAKINLDVQVLSLLQFNAGVDLSINRVALTIQNVSAKVELEARLENVLWMINDTLNSIDLNPIIATLGTDVGSLVNDTLGGDTSSASSDLSARSFNLDEGILYSVNDYSGNTHTNRILTQSGDIVDQSLHNDGSVYGSQVVGSYWHDMTFTGHERAVLYNDENVRELEYLYTPFNGLSVIAAIYLDTQGTVVGTKVLSELEGGGSSTIANE
ncbi:hypothetical protein A1O3_00433 [Capronia epimyces CBS 606.96]|uniref:Uncharacterized protein n=1 Tax=Capronia epimyces CBS 606.96 TaxID=1182542 RepID=W9YH83_9EURO|nr:uncharacterized protein A1O3_00433 [Capronia epimyces CBS 606.96]EXJ91883.1 hypothetical protein A1O3_00433 [Capronia epimyces CBS 606.96]